MYHDYVIGINFGSHDSSVTLFHKGVILCSLEEERLNKEKHTKKFPEHSLQFIISKYDLDKGKKVLVVFFMNPWRLLLSPFIVAFKSHSLNAFSRGARKSFKRLNDWYFLKKWCSKKGYSLTYIEHHLAHAASAYYLSPFDSCTIVSIDGKGEYLSVAIFEAEQGNIKKIKGFSSPFSVGYFYSFFTEFLGFSPHRDEYKVMGLAAYGSPIYIDELSEMFSFQRNGSYNINLNICRYWVKSKQTKFQNLIKYLGNYRDSNEVIEQRHKDIAASLQRHTETIVENIVAYSLNLANNENLCLTGGVALNCLSNSNLASKEYAKNIFIPPFPNDCGTSIGAALAKQKYSHYLDLKSWTPFLGIDYTNEEILKVLKIFENKIEYTFIESPNNVGAGLLADGKIIGWFQGKMEFGPRALGNRSILAPATSLEIKDKLNSLIKNREPFRPFAPMILAEYCSEYFSFNEAISSSLNFMICTAVGKEIAKEKIPGALNADDSARIQTIDKHFNFNCWELLNHYYLTTGIPAIINTSFNVNNVPIVNSPFDAVGLFIESNLDYSIIGNYLISKK